MYEQNFKTFILFCLVAFAIGHLKAAEIEEPIQATSRIVNGQEISINQAPYIVQIRSNTGLFCSGTLVTQQHVVTAAHCFDTVAPQNVVVVGGASTATEIGTQRRVVGFIKHQGYTKATMNHDVAILKLDQPMQGNNMRSIPLCSRRLSAGSALQVSGWGRMYENGPGSLQLRTVFVPTVSLQECQVQHRYSTAPITTSMLCAYAPGKDHCGGDSGGPAVSGGELCGIVSWGRGCAVNAPGVYADVLTLRSYIEQAIRSL